MHALIGHSQRSAGTKIKPTQIRRHEDVEAQNLSRDTQYRWRLEGQRGEGIKSIQQPRNESGGGRASQGAGEDPGPRTSRNPQTGRDDPDLAHLRQGPLPAEGITDPGETLIL